MAAAEGLLVDLLTGGRGHEWRAGDEELTLTLHHDDEVAQRCGERAVTCRRAVHHSDGGHPTGKIHEQGEIGGCRPAALGHG